MTARAGEGAAAPGGSGAATDVTRELPGSRPWQPDATVRGRLPPQIGVLVALVAALVWAYGSFMLAKDIESGDDTDHAAIR